VTKIQRTIEINRKPEDVFSVLTDLHQLPHWATTVVETHDIPDGPLRNGMSFRQTVRAAGRTIECDYKVTELGHPHHVAYEATALGDGQLTMRQTVSATASGSLVELELDYELPGGILGQAADRAFVERRNEREAEHSLHNLKDMLESRSS
jgi:uncharacterized protein YndB with AHSA1/START domain